MFWWLGLTSFTNTLVLDRRLVWRSLYRSCSRFGCYSILTIVCNLWMAYCILFSLCEEKIQKTPLVGSPGIEPGLEDYKSSRLPIDATPHISGFIFQNPIFYFKCISIHNLYMIFYFYYLLLGK